MDKYFKKEKASFTLPVWWSIFSIPGNVLVPIFWEFGLERETDLETNNFPNCVNWPPSRGAGNLLWDVEWGGQDFPGMGVV